MMDATLHEGRDSSRGTFRFECLPSPGDHIHVGNIRGSMDVLRVVYVEHHPVKLPPGAFARPDPYVSIYVEEVSSYGD